MSPKSKRVTKKIRVFEKLKAGKSISDIRKEEGSGSSVYNGLWMYLDWCEGRVKDLQSEIGGLEHDLVEERAVLVGVSKEIKEAEDRKEAIDSDLNIRTRDLLTIEGRLSERKREYDDFTSTLDAMRERGLTDESIARVGRIDFGSEDELLDRIGTAERYKVLERAKGHLEEENTDKTKEYQALLARLKSLGEAVASEKNELDEVRRRRVLHEEAYRVVEGFLREGYDAGLLLGILEPLKSLSVKGQPLISIQRLLDGLSGYRRLKELQEACNRKEIELARLTEELARAEATLIAVKDIVLGVIEEARDKSMEMIDRQGSEALKLSNSLKDQYALHLDELEKGQIARSERLSKKGEANIIKMQNRAIAEIKIIMNSLRTTLEQYEYGMRVWGEEKEKMGRLKDVMPYAEIIYDDHVRNVENVPVEIIFRLVYFVKIWIHTKRTDEKISPTKEIANKDLSIREYSSYKLTSMIDILAEYFFHEPLRTSK